MQRIIYFIGLFILSSAKLFAQDVRVAAQIDTNKILIGEQIQLDLSADFRVDQGAINITWPSFKDTITELIEIVAQGKIDTIIPDKDDPYHFRLEQKFILSIFDSGFHVLPPFQFKINNDSNALFETEAFLIEVQTVAVDTTQAIKDIKAPYGAAFDIKEYMDYIYIGLGILITLLLLSYFIYRWYQKRKGQHQEEKIIIPPKKAHEKALEALHELKNKKLWQGGKIKLYYSELSDIIRSYIEDRYLVYALEHTTDEILQSFQHIECPQSSKIKLKQLLRLADLVKFAKENPLPNENELSIQLAVDFVEQTKLIEEQTLKENDV